MRAHIKSVTERLSKLGRAPKKALVEKSEIQKHIQDLNENGFVVLNVGESKTFKSARNKIARRWKRVLN